MKQLSKIKSQGGFIKDGKLMGELKWINAFGYFEHVPFINADPSVNRFELVQGDEFV